VRETFLSLPGAAPGTEHRLAVLGFGDPAARPQVYVQGGLHADEGPGMIAARALGDRLAAAEAAGRLAGAVTVVPCANPIGLGQRVLGTGVGRFDLADGLNFNRAYPDLAAAAAPALGAALGPDPAANVAAARAALRDALGADPAVTPAARLKRMLLGLALDADVALDLHCDAEAELHLYGLTPQADALAPLAARLGARAVLLADVSGENPFDEAPSRPWVDLAARFPDRPIPLACLAATVELRGAAQVDHGLAARDADALMDWFADIGVVEGTPPPPAAPRCAPTPLAGSEPVIAPAPGLAVFAMPLGALARAGDRVADILDPVTGALTPVLAGADGVLYARAATRLVAAGDRLGKIAGADARRTGALLGP
jgi:hypothetical protein